MSINNLLRLIIILLCGLSCFSNISFAETDIKEQTEKKRVILDFLDEGIQAVAQPVISGEESSEGLYSFKWKAANFRLSMLDGLEMTWDESDFSMRLGGRVYTDLTFYAEDKNDLGDNGLGLRNILVELNGKFSKNWPYRLSWGEY